MENWNGIDASFEMQYRNFRALHVALEGLRDNIKAFLHTIRFMGTHMKALAENMTHFLICEPSPHTSPKTGGTGEEMKSLSTNVSEVVEHHVQFIEEALWTGVASPVSAMLVEDERMVRRVQERHEKLTAFEACIKKRNSSFETLRSKRWNDQAENRRHLAWSEFDQLNREVREEMSELCRNRSNTMRQVFGVLKSEQARFFAAVHAGVTGDGGGGNDALLPRTTPAAIQTPSHSSGAGVGAGAGAGAGAGDGTASDDDDGDHDDHAGRPQQHTAVVVATRADELFSRGVITGAERDQIRLSDQLARARSTSDSIDDGGGGGGLGGSRSSPRRHSRRGGGGGDGRATSSPSKYVPTPADFARVVEERVIEALVEEVVSEACRSGSEEDEDEEEEEEEEEEGAALDSSSEDAGETSRRRRRREQAQYRLVDIAVPPPSSPSRDANHATQAMPPSHKWYCFAVDGAHFVVRLPQAAGNASSRHTVQVPSLACGSSSDISSASLPSEAPPLLGSSSDGSETTSNSTVRGNQAPGSAGKFRDIMSIFSRRTNSGSDSGAEWSSPDVPPSGLTRDMIVHPTATTTRAEPSAAVAVAVPVPVAIAVPVAATSGGSSNANLIPATERVSLSEEMSADAASVGPNSASEAEEACRRASSPSVFFDSDEESTSGDDGEPGLLGLGSLSKLFRRRANRTVRKAPLPDGSSSPDSSVVADTDRGASRQHRSPLRRTTFDGGFPPVEDSDSNDELDAASEAFLAQGGCGEKRGEDEQQQQHTQEEHEEGDDEKRAEKMDAAREPSGGGAFRALKGAPLAAVMPLRVSHGYLDVASLGNSLAVCRLWQAALSRSPAVWRHCVRRGGIDCAPQGTRRRFWAAILLCDEDDEGDEGGAEGGPRSPKSPKPAADDSDPGECKTPRIRRMRIPWVLPTTPEVTPSNDTARLSPASPESGRGIPAAVGVEERNNGASKLGPDPIEQRRRRQREAQRRRKNGWRRVRVRRVPGLYGELVAKAREFIKEQAAHRLRSSQTSSRSKTPTAGEGGGEEEEAAAAADVNASPRRRSSFHVHGSASNWTDEIETDVARTYRAGRDLAAEAEAPSAGGEEERQNNGQENDEQPHNAKSADNGALSGTDDDNEGDDADAAVGASDSPEDKLRRVLWAFAVYSPRIGYCQGMNFVMRLLLDVCEGDEELSFWMFVAMCERYDLDNMYAPGLERLEYCFFALRQLTRRCLPELSEHFERADVAVDMFASRWFLTLFSSFDTADRELVLRIWDAFLVDRWPTLFSVALFVLREMEPLLLQSDFETMLKVVQYPRSYLRSRCGTAACSDFILQSRQFRVSGTILRSIEREWRNVLAASSK